jgi:hypothetical protein
MSFFMLGDEKVTLAMEVSLFERPKEKPAGPGRDDRAVRAGKPLEISG